MRKLLVIQFTRSKGIRYIGDFWWVRRLQIWTRNGFGSERPQRNDRFIRAQRATSKLTFFPKTSKKPTGSFLTIDRESLINRPPDNLQNQTNQPNYRMRGVTVKKGEPVDRALKRLKTKLDTEGILEEMRRRRAFETPTERKQRKLRSASKRNKIRWRYSNAPAAEKVESAD